MKRIVSFQGAPGAFSHSACTEALPDYEPLPCRTFEDAFAAVQEKNAKLAMIPIENSSAGRVADIHHLLPTSGLHIVGEHFLPVHFQLMGIPGSRIEEIRDIQSHIHALGQCRRIIRRLGAIAHVAGDTAGSARDVAEAGDRTRAALSPRLAAELYGLEILAEDVEDEAHNTTRFIVLSRDPGRAVSAEHGWVTAFVFRVRNLPAALYKTLGGFATNGVNMTKLESYMVEGEFTATQFYAEVDGHPDEPGLARAIEELGFFTQEFTVLGVFPAHAFRAQGRMQAAD